MSKMTVKNPQDVQVLSVVFIFIKQVVNSVGIGKKITFNEVPQNCLFVKNLFSIF